MHGEGLFPGKLGVLVLSPGERTNNMSIIFKSSAAAVAFALVALPCTALADANPLNEVVPVVDFHHWTLIGSGLTMNVEMPTDFHFVSPYPVKP